MSASFWDSLWQTLFVQGAALTIVLAGLSDGLGTQSIVLLVNRITPLRFAANLIIATAVLAPADMKVCDQTISQMLASYAATSDTDLIVMTTHGRGGLARFWLGSVADALVRTSPIPLLLVHPDRTIARCINR